MAELHEKQIEKLLKKHGIIINTDRKELLELAEELKNDIWDSITASDFSANVQNLLKYALVIQIYDDRAIVTFNTDEVTRFSIYTKIDKNGFNYAASHKATAYLPLVYNYSNHFSIMPKYYNTKKNDPQYGGKGVFVLTKYKEFAHTQGTGFIEMGAAVFKIKHPKSQIEIVTG